MMKFLQIPLAMLLACTLPACGPQPAQALLAPARSDQPAFSSSVSPALWKVTSKGKTHGTVYLFGAIHLLPRETVWQGPLLDRAIEASDSLTIEVTAVNDAAAVSKQFSAMAVTPGLPPITERIDPKLRRQFNAVVGQSSSTMTELNRLETWAAALRIIPLFSADIGLSAAYAVDAVLQQRFASLGKPVLAMETVSQQFSYFDSLPEGDQRKMLNAVLKNASGQKDHAKKLLNAWLRGDQAKLRVEAQSGIIASPRMREVLLDGRNRNWTTQIAGWLDAKEHRFIALGAGHLAGPLGVPALLAEKGYQVTRIQ
jgi:uncharacterized protein